MATLTNTKIKDTYDGLLKTNDNGVLGGTSKEITDGLGNGSGIYIGTNERLGVGTSSARSLLDLDNGTTTGALANFDFGGTGGWNQYRYNGGTVGYIGQGNGLLSPTGSTSEFVIRSQDELVFATGGGSEHMRIDSSGNVGINTDNPQQLLQVTGNPAMFRLECSDITLDVNQVLGGIEVYSNDNNGVGVGVKTSIKTISENSSGSLIGMAFSTTENTGSNEVERMRIDAIGNVGIGTSNVSASSFSGSTKILEVAHNNAAVLSLNNTSNVRHQIISDASGSLTFWDDTNNAERMRINSSGNVGIGTTPNSWISVYRSLQIGVGASISGRTDDNLLELNSNSYRSTSGAWKYITSNSAARQDLSNGEIRWYNAPSGTAGNNITFTERMRISSDGSVLVGTTADDPISSSSIGWSFSGSDKILRGYQSDAPLIALSRGANGQVVIFNNGLTTVGNISITGSATAYNTSSDYRLKEDWQPMAGALDRVDTLKPVNFAWKSDGSRVDGFLAHELAEVLPEAVTGEKDATEEYEITPAVLDLEGNVIEEAVMGTRDVYQGIDQSKIVPLLVAAIQELRAEIELLKN